ncbi:hypothetical protein [Streptomyces griseus]|uniref:hypothetical protein n=1 Tax=Streptomyces griseus TaxID=1911 RepID=UPI000B22F816|nr:hypothetical protein [Streptomyces griseus]
MALAPVALGGLGRAPTSQRVRSLVPAGAAHTAATVVSAGNARQRRDDEDGVTGCRSTLVLSVPGHDSAAGAPRGELRPQGQGPPGQPMAIWSTRKTVAR